jgi:dienelactone hydrolase
MIVSLLSSRTVLNKLRLSFLFLLSVIIKANGQFFPPIPSGNYHVGFRSLTFERTLPNLQIRELNTWLFYPSIRIERKKQRGYLSDLKLLAAMKQERYLGFSDSVLTSWVNLKTNSFEDIPAVRKKFPMVIILHGRGSSKTNYTWLAEEICSHGYVVIIADYPGSGLTIVSDGTVVGLNNPADLQDEVKQMSDDTCFLLHELSNNNFVSGIADPNNIGMIGHSLGSMAVFNIGLDNCGFKAAINFDGYPFGEAIERGVNIPHLTLWGELPGHLGVPIDTLKKRRDKIWSNFIEASGNSFLVVKVKGMYHTDFNDLIFLRSNNERARNQGSIHAQKGFQIVSALTIAYLNHKLKGEKNQVFRDYIRSTPELSIELNSGND